MIAQLVVTRSLPSTGDILGGRYLLGKILGAGGMGIVYEAIDQALEDRPIAVKLLYPHLLSEEDRVGFRREVLIARRLAHENIVQMFGLGSNPDGEIYITMELVKGGNLRASTNRKSAAEWEQSLLYVYQIARGISHAHQHGVLHCDIKPQNIMLSEAGTAKVADFGIAQFVAAGKAGESRGICRGTPAYMSPEQFRGEMLDERSDIYSFGITAYELLYGNTPFSGDSFYELGTCHLEKELPAPGHEPAPGWIFDLLTLCTAKKREDRPADLDAVARVIFDNMRDSKIGSLFAKAAERSSYALSSNSPVDIVEAPEAFRKTYMKWFGLFVAIACFIGYFLTPVSDQPKPLWLCVSVGGLIIFFGETKGGGRRKRAFVLNAFGSLVICLGFNPSINYRVASISLRLERATGINLFPFRSLLGRPLRLDNTDDLFAAFSSKERDKDFRAMIMSGMNANVIRNGNALLHHAVEGSQAGLIPTLVRYGADLEMKNAKGDTPAELAIRIGAAQELESLLVEGALMCGPTVKKPLLIQAIERRHPLATYIIVQLGALQKAECLEDYRRLNSDPHDLARRVGVGSIIEILRRGVHPDPTAARFFEKAEVARIFGL